MSDRVNSQPTTETNDTPVAAKPTNMQAAKAKALAARATAFAFVKKNPLAAGVIGMAVLAGGYYYAPASAPHGTPAHLAGLTAAPSKTVTTGQVDTQEMVVQSGRKTDKLLILNNTRDYKQATMTVVVDLEKCPELGQLTPKALYGQTIRARGERQTYDGKPQLRVTSAKNLTVDPSAATESAKK